MFAKSKIILVPLLCLIFGAVIKESGQLPQESECLRLCRLAREEGSETGVQVSSRMPLCNECLHKSKDHALNQQGVKQRKRKSLHPQPSDCPGSSQDQLEEWTPSEVEVNFGQYINTNHWYLNCSWTSMNDSYGQWNGILVRLVVGDPDDFMTPVNCYVLPKNQTFFKVNISSHHYQYPNDIYLKVIGLPFVNDVSDIHVYCPITTPSSPITTHSSTRDHSGHLATDPVSTPSSPIITPSSNRDHSTAKSVHLTTESNNVVAYAVSISTGTLVGLILVVGLLVYLLLCRKEGNRTRRNPLSLDFQYDAFIIYNNEDRLWMKNKLLPFLEEKNHLTCCIHYRDFVAGKSFRDCMAESVYKSHKVIALFSSNFVQSNYCKYELDLAIGRLVAHRDRSLVVIRIDGVDFELLPPELRDHGIIDYNDPLEKHFWKRKLLTFLGLLEDSESQTTSGRGNCDNNNSYTYYANMNGNRTKTGFSRLNSTTSNDSEISYV